NMADAVWSTLTKYDIQGRILAFVMDNATNNDTMLDEIEDLCTNAGIDFSAKRSRLRCMPHTVHLAALKLLEAIGAINKSESKKAAGRNSGYQESATLPVDRDQDEEAVLRED
ncbi:hypothetical protein BDZ89DRAFT_888537, partial [Hymenopellis radicata]